MLKTILKYTGLLLLILSIGLTGFVALRLPGGLSGFWTMLSTVTGLNTATADDIQSMHVAQGFSLELVADNLGYARFILVTDNNDLIVSITDRGQLILLQDRDNNGSAETQTLLVEGLNAPQGLAFHGPWLYFSERDKINRVPFDQSAGKLLGEIETLIENLPYGHPHDSHNSKALGISPDGKLHINVGSPCNICEPQDHRYAAMLTAELDGSNLQRHATGLRNSIDFDWAPWSGDLYATDNARDMLGDDFPPDELNLIQQGGFYGWPYYHGDNVADPEYGQKRPDLQKTAIKPVHKFRAHNAPLGIHFVRPHPQLPADFHRTALVALHGSWNRSTLDGYKVVSLHWDSEGHIEQRDFLNGFLTDRGITGRPVAIDQDQQGRFYITDDLAGRVYRVQYTGG